MKTFLIVICALLFAVNAEAQNVLFSDSTSSAKLTRAVGTTTFYTEYWGPYDVSECWRLFNLPAQALDGDTMKFDGFLSAAITYSTTDSCNATFRAALSPIPFPSLTAIDYTLFDSTATKKFRAASDTLICYADDVVGSVWLSLGGTAATDTTMPCYLYIQMKVDSAHNSPTRIDDFGARWTFSCPSALAK